MGDHADPALADGCLALADARLAGELPKAAELPITVGDACGGHLRRHGLNRGGDGKWPVTLRSSKVLATPVKSLLGHHDVRRSVDGRDGVGLDRSVDRRDGLTYASR